MRLGGAHIHHKVCIFFHVLLPLLLLLLSPASKSKKLNFVSVSVRADARQRGASSRCSSRQVAAAMPCSAV